MKPFFFSGPVNGPFDDPSLYVRLLREGRALLFDAGDISRLETGEILKISDIFITHMHIDHFIGLDTIIRTMLRREEPLRIFGPENIISCVEGKLRGYTWNLITAYPVCIEVYELRRDCVQHASFRAENVFAREDRQARAFSSNILEAPLFTVKALHVTHDVPSLAYSLEEGMRININRDALHEMGLSVGPWLAEFKEAIRRAAPEDSIMDAGGRSMKLAELMPIAMIGRGEKIAYVMDVAPEEGNINNIIEFVRGADTLYCEGYFMNADHDRAMERHHLTASIAGRIAREAEAGRLELMHFSPKYTGSEQALYREAEAEYGNAVQQYTYKRSADETAYSCD